MKVLSRTETKTRTGKTEVTVVAKWKGGHRGRVSWLTDGKTVTEVLVGGWLTNEEETELRKEVRA